MPLHAWVRCKKIAPRAMSKTARFFPKAEMAS
jgi:hypothetical protein